MYKILLFLYANNFLTLSNYIAIILVIYCLLKTRFKVLLMSSKTFSLLILSSFSYMILYIYNYGFPGFSTFFLRFLAPLLLYFIGINQGTKGIYQFLDNMLIIGFAQFFHGFMNVILNRNVQVLSISGRQYQDIYGGSISATLQNLLFIVICSLLFYNIFCEKRITVKIFGILASLGGIYGTIANASRTLIYLTLISFLVAFVMYSYLYRNNRQIAKIWLVVIFAAALFIMIVWLNLFNIIGWFTNTALGQRLAKSSTSGIASNLRFTYAVDVLRLLFKYPMGIPYSYYSHYAHNLWLDIARETGVVPFILYLWFSILSIKSIIKTLRSKFIPKEAKIFIVSLTSAFFMSFFAEPVLIGAPQIFSIYCFMIGYLSSINTNERNMVTYENSTN